MRRALFFAFAALALATAGCGESDPATGDVARPGSELFADADEVNPSDDTREPETSLLDVETEVEVTPGPDGSETVVACDEEFPTPLTCAILRAAATDALEAAQQCEAHDDCSVILDPTCAPDGGYPIAISSTGDRLKYECLLQLWVDLSCEGPKCQWDSDLPQATCRSTGLCDW